VKTLRPMAQASSSSCAPPLSSAILSHIAADWPEFAEIRAAARALSHKSRLTNALSIAVNEVRVALAAALLSSGRPGAHVSVLSREDEAARLGVIQRALRLHAHSRAVLSDCAGPLSTEWHLSCDQIRKVMAAFGSVSGGSGSEPSSMPAPIPTSPPRPLAQDYGQTVHLFLAAVAQGMSAEATLAAFGQVGSGHFSHDDTCFFPEHAALGPVADRIRLLPGADRRVVRGCEGEADITLFLVNGAIAALACGKRLRSQWLEDVRRDAGGLESLPDFIALPRDVDSRPIIPTSQVTALVEAQEARSTELGTLDAVTSSITRGQLVMPRISAPS